ncbi:hypothetical protein HUJ05_000742 [Dendroctonus ponderosae]|nr:hypothetical protein HUJ05_000742 [Dendroctonus ponderosae]
MSQRRKALENIGIKDNGVNTNNLRHADDTLLLTSSQEDLHMLVDSVSIVRDEYGLKHNTKRLTYGILIEKIYSITYLGCNISDNWDMSKELRIRIEKARDAFLKMRRVICGRSLSNKLKISRKIRNSSAYNTKENSRKKMARPGINILAKEPLRLV